MSKRGNHRSSKSDHESPATLGTLLAAIRKRKNLPIEKVAHDTRIRVARLQDIEADDLTRMDPAYARLFLLEYAKYLDVPFSDVQPFLPDRADFGIAGYDYIHNAPGNARGGYVRRRRPPRKRRIVLVLIVLILLLAAGFKGWIVWRKIGQISNSELSLLDRAELLKEPPPSNFQEFRSQAEPQAGPVQHTPTVEGPPAQEARPGEDVPHSLQ